MKKVFITVILFLLISFTASAQVTGLSGWNIYLDPGHSQNENVGAWGYSEAHKVLRVGLALREMLLNETDIDTVYICRTTDTELVSLSQRTTHANQVGAAWYHSIHSDAGSSTANSTLLLWGQMPDLSEKTPNGGKAMSSHMVDLLTRGYRTNTSGSKGDYSFYGKCPDTRPCPYLWVNYATNMPSELSEAGFHTHPTQNMINMNAEWKKLEARTFFWSILKHHNIARPATNIVAGHIKDIEDNIFVNGATVSIDGKTYITDTFESLFKNYSSDPKQLKNGFFYFENVSPGIQTITVTTPDHYEFTAEISVNDTFFSFVDPTILSLVPPTVVSTTPAQNDSLYPGTQNMTIVFSRPMDKASVQNNISITPAAELTFNWTDGDRKLVIGTANMINETDYTITISGLSKDKHEHPFDGNADRTGGDDYLYHFRTKVMDAVAPQFLSVFPKGNETKTSLQPILSVVFDEPVKLSTLSGKVKLTRTSDQTPVTLPIQKHYSVGGKSVLNIFVRTVLQPNTNYTVTVEPGIEDLYGNAMTERLESAFTTGDTLSGTVTIFDNFEAGIGKWWQPAQSGSTAGILPTETSIAEASDIYNAITVGTKSMRLNYGYDLAVSNWLIREYTPDVSTSPRFNGNATLVVYLFGDGNKNTFRFAVREKPANTLEASKWVEVDWHGWKEVRWTPNIDGAVAFTGNGIIEGEMILDSYQFSYKSGNNNIGTYYIDDALIIHNAAPVDIENKENIQPAEYVLDQNYPNPFNPSTKIRFGLKNSSNVKLEVFNLLGQKVITLVDGYLETGYHTVTFDASNLPSGVYVYRIESPEFITSKKLVLMK
jgi:N-acetylmuramoyl-L-alanine amidase